MHFLQREGFATGWDIWMLQKCPLMSHTAVNLQVAKIPTNTPPPPLYPSPAFYAIGNERMRPKFSRWYHKKPKYWTRCGAITCIFQSKTSASSWYVLKEHNSISDSVLILYTCIYTSPRLLCICYHSIFDIAIIEN